MLLEDRKRGATAFDNYISYDFSNNVDRFRVRSTVQSDGAVRITVAVETLVDRIVRPTGAPLARSLPRPLGGSADRSTDGSNSRTGGSGGRAII